MTVAPSRVQELASRFPAQRILVVGDLMLDRFIYGKVSRISPEAPVPVVQVQREKAMPGGATNVAWNIRAMGGEGEVGGVLGQDRDAEVLSALLDERQVGRGAVVRDPGVPTTVKTRVIAERQQVVRVDWDGPGRYDAGLLQDFCAQLDLVLPRCTGAIIEDYGKGVVDQVVVDTVLRKAKALGIPVGFDPKDNHALDVRGVTVATPNRWEAFLAAGVADKTPEAPPLEDVHLQRAVEVLMERWAPSILLVTLGAQGMLLVEKGRAPRHAPTRAREVFDVSGAGDTVIATFVLALAAGASAFEAAELSNAAAGVVVGKLGTATCSVAELREFFT